MSDGIVQSGAHMFTSGSGSLHNFRSAYIVGDSADSGLSSCSLRSSNRFHRHNHLQLVLKLKPNNMLAFRLCAFPGLASTLSRSAISTAQKPVLDCSRFQNYAQQATRISARRAVRAEQQSKMSLKERIMAPGGESAFTIGRGVLAGSSVLGLGALCYYGMGLSNQIGAIDRAMFWPQIVKDRIRNTYLYFGGGLIFTAGTAVAVAKNNALMKIVSKGSWMTMLGCFAAVIGSGMVVHSLPYREGFGAKQLAWMGHAAVMGAVIAPITFLGGPLLVRAAVYTAGVIGGLSTVAVCAPSDKFLNMAGPLAIGLGVVFASSIGGMFLPPTTALGAGLYSISMYGGLVLFSMFLLYDTQKIIHRAENHPTYRTAPYDPINASLGIYADTLNIFIRIAMILSGGNRKK